MGMIVLLAGLPGVGKSTLAAPLAAAIGAVIIDRDGIKDCVIPQAYLTHSPAQTALAGRVSALVCQTVLAEHPGADVIIDGHTFSRRSDIDRYRDIADSTAARLLIVHCVASEEAVAARIAGDADGVAKDRTWQKYLDVKERFEPLDGEVITVDLTGPPQAAVQEVLSHLAHWRAR